MALGLVRSENHPVHLTSVVRRGVDLKGSHVALPMSKLATASFLLALPRDFDADRM